MSTLNIFNTLGEDSFRKKELEVLDDILLEDEYVLATGGGTPCFFNNIEKMNNKGVTIYLLMNTGFLLHRLTNAKTKRPLLQNISDQELTKFIESQIKSREKYYLQAKYIVKGNDINVSELADKIR